MANNIPDNQSDTNSKPAAGAIVPPSQDLAVNLIRSKLNSLYDEEPDAKTEEAEVISRTYRSKHQQYMYDLMTSGKDLVQIQTEWHNYYQSLNDDDKKQVWQEFYDSNQNRVTTNLSQKQQEQEIAELSQKTDAESIRQAKQKRDESKKQAAKEKAKQAQKLAQHVHERAVSKTKTHTERAKNAAAIRKNIRSSVNVPPKLTWKHHLQSALFGLSMGLLVVFILLFGFFNEIIIAPFIQPSRNNTATPIILSSSSIAPSPNPEVIIPKINVEIPVNYSVNTTNENVIENFLEDGVVHYPTTSVPGQDGNAAYFGHSANNIFNPGRYKFAFVLLHDLVPGDVFYLTYNDKVYAYKVFSTKIVNPDDVSVLNPVPGHQATATLITCDPPGTSLNRLVVVGDQISPNPSGNSTASTPTINTASAVSQLPGNGPTLWHRFISTIWGKIVSVLFIVGVLLIVWRWYVRKFQTEL